MLKLLVVLLISCGVGTLGLRNSLAMTSSGVFGKYLVKNFGMTTGGMIDVTYAVTSDIPEWKGYILLLVITEIQKSSWYGNVDNGVTTSTVGNLCSMPSIARKILNGNGTMSLKIDPSLGSSQYSVLLLQCKEDSFHPISIVVDTEMRNIRPGGKHYSQLSIDDVMVTRVLEGELIVYSLFVLGMIGQIFFAKSSIMAIHWLFLATVVVTLGLVIVEYYDYYHYNVHGRELDSIRIAFNVFVVLSDTAQLASLLLLSLGWTLVRSGLSFKEHRSVWTAIAAYFAFGMCGASCLDERTSSCEAVNLIAFIIKSLLLLAIIISMNFTVTQLRSMLQHSPWVPSTPLQYARSKQYQMFRLVFILYLLLPTAFLLVQTTMFTWKESWIQFLLNDLLTIFMFFHIGVTFSPLQEPLLIRAFDGSLNLTQRNE